MGRNLPSDEQDPLVVANVAVVRGEVSALLQQAGFNDRMPAADDLMGRPITVSTPESIEIARVNVPVVQLGANQPSFLGQRSEGARHVQLVENCRVAPQIDQVPDNLRPKLAKHALLF